MQNDSGKKRADDMRPWASDLVCPVCLAPLRFSEAVVCTGCARTYPIVDGIPVLIPDRASTPAE
jgi:uncharacterized protein YbaR (Trm112 family)